MNTSGYGGRTLTKKISVHTNDSNKPLLYLTVIGNVENFVTIVPRRVNLRGFAGGRIKTIVKIMPEEKYPFKIVGVQAAYEKHIRYKLKKVNRSKRIEYILTVENLKKEKGRYFDTIKLKTDSKIRPEIKISVYGQILDRPSKEQK